MNRRRFMSQGVVTYTLYSNQGSPEVYVDGIKVAVVDNGKAEWTSKQYNKDVTIELKGVTIQPTSVYSGWDHGNEVDGVYIGWQGQWAKFTGWLETKTYRFISGNYRDTYRNTAVTKSILSKGSTEITINQSTVKVSREWYDTDVVTYNKSYETSTDGMWDGSVSISGDTVTVNYGTDGGWSVSIAINGNYDNKSMDFDAA